MTRKKPKRMTLVGIRDELKLIRIGTDVCTPPAGRLKSLGPLGDDVFQSATYSCTCASLLLVDKAVCLCNAF